MSSRLQLDVRNLSLGMRHLVNAYKVETLQVRCNLQVTLCDPYLSALSVRYYNKGAIQIHFLYLLPLNAEIKNNHKNVLSDFFRPRKTHKQKSLCLLPPFLIILNDSVDISF